MIHVIDCISIHSTTRVETWGTYLRRNGFRNFNPLHHEGGDNKHFSQPFNRYNFNPLHHEGGDLIQSFVSFCFLLFQSTPPRGWRPNPNSVRLTSASFQSTPPRGWRLPALSSLTVCWFYFNPLHHEGGDLPLPCHPPPPPDFNPLHHVGGDESTTWVLSTISEFQSTPPRGWRHSARI